MSRSRLLGILCLDEMVAGVLEHATEVGWLEGALEGAADEPSVGGSVADQARAALAIAGIAASPPRPAAAATALVALARLAKEGQFLPEWPAAVVEASFFELSSLPAPWGTVFGEAAARAATWREGFDRPPAPPAPVGPGQRRIGRYVTLGLLGRGTTGTVYRARQDGTGREVALKVLRLDAVTAEVLARFRHEAVLLGQLDHTAIAKVFESGVAEVQGESVPFLALELVEGNGLVAHAAQASCSDLQRIDLVRQVAAGVHHAHDKGIVHRDLSPSNVLVTADGRPKIIDFGLARILDPDLRTTALRTTTGAVFGTPAYMSPEQAAGDVEHVDARTDVWALGVLLFELLTGRLPFDEVAGRPVTEVLRRLAEDEPRRLRSLRPDLGADVDAVVGKALEPDRDARYPTAQALHDDLAQLVAGAAVTARPPTALESARRFVRRHRVLVALTTSVLVVLATGLAVALTGWRRATSAEALASARLEAMGRMFEIPLAFAEVDERSLVPTEKTLAMLGSIEQALPLLRDLPDAGRFAELAAVFHEQMGDAYIRQQDLPNAEAHFRQCEEHWTRIAARTPGAARPRARVAIALTKVGNVREHQGRTEEAVKIYRDVLRRNELLVAEYPGDDDLLDDLAWSWHRIASLDSLRLPLADVIEPYARALAAMQAAFARKPSDEDRVFGMANMHHDIAYALDRLGAEPAVIEHHYEAAHVFARRLRERHADNADYACVLQSLALNRGIWRLRCGDVEEAIVELEDAVARARRWITASIHVTTMTRGVAWALEALAAAHLADDDLASTTTTLQELREQLFVAASLVQVPASELALLRLEGDLAWRRDQRRDAERLWRQAATNGGAGPGDSVVLARLARHGLLTPSERMALTLQLQEQAGSSQPLTIGRVADAHDLLGETDRAAALRRGLEAAAQPAVERQRQILGGSR